MPPRSIIKSAAQYLFIGAPQVAIGIKTGADIFFELSAPILDLISAELRLVNDNGF